MNWRGPAVHPVRYSRRDVMSSPDHPGIHRSCALSLSTACNPRPRSRLQRRELARLAAALQSRPCAIRARCPVSRGNPGYLADLGSCWYRRFPWSPVSWRLSGPHG